MITEFSCDNSKSCLESQITASWVEPCQRFPALSTSLLSKSFVNITFCEAENGNLLRQDDSPLKSLLTPGRILWNRACLSFYLSGHFLVIVLLVFFSEFWHGAKNPYEVVRDRDRLSGKFFFAPKCGKMDPK